MSVIGRAFEAKDSPRGKATTDDLGARTYEREFQVECTSIADGLSIVTNAPGIPRLWEPYVFGTDRDNYALARSIEARRLAPASRFWIVSVEYRTFNKQELLAQYENPLLQLPEIETYLEKFQEPVYAVYDIDNMKFTPCRNSAGQVFDPPPMKDSSRLVMTITRNEALSILHPSVDVAYQDAVNSDVWWNLEPGVWKCQGVTTRRELKQLQSGLIFPYLRCVYKFEARPTWDARILDAGSYYLNTVEGVEKKLFFQGDDGQPITGLLDGTGHKLDAGGIPVFKLFRLYDRRPFGALNLPQSFTFAA